MSNVFYDTFSIEQLDNNFGTGAASSEMAPQNWNPSTFNRWVAEKAITETPGAGSGSYTFTNVNSFFGSVGSGITYAANSYLAEDKFTVNGNPNPPLNSYSTYYRSIYLLYESPNPSVYRVDATNITKLILNGFKIKTTPSPPASLIWEGINANVTLKSTVGLIVGSTTFNYTTLPVNQNPQQLILSLPVVQSGAFYPSYVTSIEIEFVFIRLITNSVNTSVDMTLEMTDASFGY